MAAAADPAGQDPDRPHREFHDVAHLVLLHQPPESCDVPGGQTFQARVRGQHHLVAERAGGGVGGSGAFDEAVPEFAVVRAGGVDVAGLDVRDDLPHERREHAGGVGAHPRQIHRPDQAAGERVDDRVPVTGEVAQDLREVLLAVDEDPGAGLERRADAVVAHRVLGEGGTVIDSPPQEHAGDPGVVAHRADDPALAVREQEHGSGVLEDLVEVVHHRSGGLGETVGPGGVRIGGTGARALRGQSARGGPAPGQVHRVLAGRDGGVDCLGHGAPPAG